MKQHLKSVWHKEKNHFWKTYPVNHIILYTKLTNRKKRFSHLFVAGFAPGKNNEPFSNPYSAP